MASTFVKSNKMRRMESKKSRSWWWDSHISPKNSKWVQDNVEQMDQNVKRMLKLIEEDADSFAKRAEMYYQKRPELVTLVEEFYRMYRSLAERYDHVTGELRKNVPSDLQSQGSGISDVGSEPPSRLPSPDRRPSRPKPGPRAAGFEFFLGTGGSSSDLGKEGDESSTLDSESESDDSSINNYSSTLSTDDDQGLRRKISELEVELRDVKEKLRANQEDISESSFRGSHVGGNENALARIAGYDEELRNAKEKIRLSEEEISRLRIELQRYESGDYARNIHELNAGQEAKISDEENAIEEEPQVLDPESKIRTLEEELRSTIEKLHDSEKEVERLREELKSNGSSNKLLQDQLGSAQKDVSGWKAKLEREKREVSKLQDRIARYKSNLSDRDQEIRGLKESISNANKALAEENMQLQGEITKLLKERAYLEDNIKEMDLRCQSLEEDVRRTAAGKEEMEMLLKSEIEQLKFTIAERESHIEELNRSLDTLSQKYDVLVTEKDALNARVACLDEELSSKDDQIDQMNNHLHQLHIEHVALISETEGARKTVEELRSRVKELEREVERQKEIVSEGAEEKREAIRQLCFSLEHYRNGYQRLRQALEHKRLPVMAS
ncbi:PREDICTED: protein NETWORKED 4A [Nicotiana attenuata]|uniref:Protein networked 4a n=1 Tax=Nicotiana attenuata TaxID=49451 RepID=A0A314KHE9_NICAT|nr:PREDICTED: protein NETWORKED 4A [Nicotiana attenuata]OIT28755.1 protein networked 4a [Nicotiana attenuata]